jgi:hypothetical protein
VSRGGTRSGAGRPGWRRRCEYQLPLDIRRLHRKRLMQPGRWFNWYWSREGERIAEAGVRAEADVIVMNYMWTPYGYEPRTIECRIALTRTFCRFGGTRSWFICPDCGRRCAVLYGVSRYGNFACRVCRRLGYLSESESPVDRCWRQQRKIEAKLTEDGERPRGMRVRTFERLCAKWEAIEERKDELWWPSFAAFAVRVGLVADKLFD